MTIIVATTTAPNVLQSALQIEQVHQLTCLFRFGAVENVDPHSWHAYVVGSWWTRRLCAATAAVEANFRSQPATSHSISKIFKRSEPDGRGVRPLDGVSFRRFSIRTRSRWSADWLPSPLSWPLPPLAGRCPPLCRPLELLGSSASPPDCALCPLRGMLDVRSANILYGNQKAIPALLLK